MMANELVDAVMVTAVVWCITFFIILSATAFLFVGLAWYDEVQAKKWEKEDRG